MEDIVIVCSITFIILMTIAWPHFVGWAEWWPTSLNKARKMLNLAKLKKGEKIYDLGCGDGRIPIIASNEFGANATGIEVDPLRYLMARLASNIFSKSRAKIVFGNFEKINLRDADVIAIFLREKANERIKSKLKSELKKGARIVSNNWTFKGWKPVQVDVKNKIYLYSTKSFKR